jgi:hypothetical protein
VQYWYKQGIADGMALALARAHHGMEAMPAPEDLPVAVSAGRADTAAQPVDYMYSGGWHDGAMSAPVARADAAEQLADGALVSQQQADGGTQSGGRRLSSISLFEDGGKVGLIERETGAALPAPAASRPAEKK